ncbi:fumarylacetoacetate hydrolase family protein [Thermodesulfobacteriota bacterium]
MRIVRFRFQEKIKYGILQNNDIKSFSEDPFNHFKISGSLPIPDGSTYNLDEVRLLSPCLPSKVVGVGLNYPKHIDEVDFDPPQVPIIFLKPSTAVIGPEDNIILKRPSAHVVFEGEFGVVIGKIAKDVPEEKAKEYIMGYTCCNDVSDRDALKEDNLQATRGKGFDTFAPIGPWIETEIDPDDLKIETYLNGEQHQSARTSGLIFKIPKLINFISGVMTLLPGDVIATGTPAGVGQMNPGDVVEVKIEKIGTLKNYLVGQA